MSFRQMDANSSKEKWKVWTPLFFSLVLIVGMVLGFNLRDTLRNKRDIGTIVERNDRLEEIIDLVNEKYVDTINSNHLYKDAVSGILKSLDPHTVYIPAEDLQGVNDDLDGGFSGIGVEFSILRDTIGITSVIENGPASRAGIHTGDQLVKVGDSIVAGNGINSDRIIHLLKGKQRSKVLVTLRMPESNSLKEVPIIRDIIPIYSVDASLMLDNNTGYIKINRFSATTYKEFASALDVLKENGAKQMVVDLRENPGGYLDAANSIAGDFLGDNKLVVYTKGTHTIKTEYRANEEGAFTAGKLIVLVDEGSASASEILAGSIQDWDRGVIMGRRTYGKGLVQEQYEMPDGAALRLTIAKYYTPSGRCIQRSFANGKAAYREDYEKRFETGELIGFDTTANTDTVKFYTSRNRVVYGGGGIKPDVYVPYDTNRISNVIIEALSSDELKIALWDYFITNRNSFKFKDIKDFEENFEETDEVKDLFLSDLKGDTRRSVVKALQKRTASTYFNLHLKARLARYLFHDNGYYSITVKDDNMVKKALALIHSNEYSKLIKRK